MGVFFAAIYRFLHRRKIFFFLFLLVSIAFVAYFAPKIQLEEDITKMMPRDAKIEQLNTIFNNSKFLDRLVVTVSPGDTTKSADPEQLGNFTDSLLLKIQELQPAYIKEINWKIDQDLMMNLYATFLDNIPVFLESADYEQLSHRIQPDSIALQMEKNYKSLLSPAGFAIKKNILNDPLGITPQALKRLQSLQFDDNFELDNGYIFTKDKRHLLFFITPAEKSSKTGKNQQLLEKLDSIIAQTTRQFKGSISAEYFGSAAVAVGNASQIKKDVQLTQSITFLFLFLFISFFYRRIEVFFVIFIPVAFGAAFSLSFLYLTQGSISAIALGAGSTILGIAMDYTIHFYTHFKHLNNAEQTVKDLSFPLTLGSTTTIGALLSLAFIKSDALRDFGLFAGLSLLGAALFTLILFPHFMRKKKEDDPKLHRKPNFVEKIAAYDYDKNPYLLALILIVCVISIFSSQKVKFESDMMNVNYVPKKLADAEQHLNSISNVSLKSVYLISSGKTLDDALTNNERQLPLLDKLQAQGLVKKYSSVSTLLLSRAEQQKRIERWNQFWTPERKLQTKNWLIEKSAPYKFKETAFAPFYSLLEKDFHPIQPEVFNEFKSSLLDNFITQHPDETTVITVLKTTAGNEDRVVNSIKENDHLIVFDKKFLTNRFVQLIQNNFNLILAISSLLVLIMLIISYGRFELAVITYLPMVLSWLCILGIMGLFEIKFNIINIIISTFIFGLGDDYAIFITDALMQEYKTGEKNLASYKTGIVISAITTMIGIGVLVFASHPALKSIGLITIIGMLSVLIISNTIQPMLFRFFISKRAAKKRVPFTFLSILQSVFAFTWFAAGCFVLIVIGGVVLYLLPLPKKNRKKIFHFLRSAFNKSMIHVNVHVKKTYYNENKERFDKPAVVIANHHSVIDALLMQSLSPKLILMANDWVFKSPFMGPIVRMGGFVPRSAGYDANLVQIRNLISDGYSIVIFPQGSRSGSEEIGRFHKGAFFIAEQLKLDIVPIVIHGTGYVQGKDDSFLLKPGEIAVKYLPRIHPENSFFGKDYQERTKKIANYFRSEYNQMREQIETVDYFANRLSKNYIYKGPVLEWYMRIKVKLEGNYQLFDSLLPKKGTITDIGCGYGFLAYMLNFRSKERIIYGTDYDEEKIAVANHCFSKTANMHFFAADATQCDLPSSDAIVLSDILHYLPKQQQALLIQKTLKALNPGGILLIRDGDAALQKRHKGTRLSEFFSTNIGFNKTTNKLEFVEAGFIVDIVQAANCSVERIDTTKFTSNIIFVVRKKN